MVLFNMRIKGYFVLCLLYLLLTSVAHADNVNARSVIVVDAKTDEILFAKDPDLRLQPASTLKLMTAIVAVEELSLNDIVVVSKKAASQQPSNIDLKEGERVRVEDLLYAALMESANDAAMALAEAVSGNEQRFVELMNQKALQIGAMDTRFVNANGLPADGQYTTVRDLVRIMRYAIDIPIIREILSTRFKMISTVDGREVFLKNTNKLLWMSDNFIGGKTGYTRAARHCFVGMAMNGESGIIVSILGSPNRQDLWSEAIWLFEKGVRVLSNQDEPTIIKTASKPKTIVSSRSNRKRIAYRYKKKSRL
ncbi:MAG: D-alanyl-D-alanine carboxypeptidase family protein [Thermodesulfovibrionia bacterium]